MYMYFAIETRKCWTHVFKESVYVDIGFPIPHIYQVLMLTSSDPRRKSEQLKFSRNGRPNSGIFFFLQRTDTISRKVNPASS